MKPTPTANNSATNPASKTFLEIKNWAKFQKPNTTQWIKDYSNREDDREFALLTMTQRGTLEGLCRLRARLGKAIPYDPAYIARALQILPEERHCCPRTLRILVQSGFLIPTESQSLSDAQQGDKTGLSHGQDMPKPGISGGQEGYKTPIRTIVPQENQQLSFENDPRLEKIRLEEMRVREKEPAESAHSLSDNKTLADKIEAKACQTFETTGNAKLKAAILTALDAGNSPKDVLAALNSTPIESNDRMKWKTLADNLPVALIQMEEYRAEARKTEDMVRECTENERAKFLKEEEERARKEADEAALIEENLSFFAKPEEASDTSELDSIPELDLASVPELDVDRVPTMNCAE